MISQVTEIEHGFTKRYGRVRQASRNATAGYAKRFGRVCEASRNDVSMIHSLHITYGERDDWTFHVVTREET